MTGICVVTMLWFLGFQKFGIIHFLGWYLIHACRTWLCIPSAFTPDHQDHCACSRTRATWELWRLPFVFLALLHACPPSRSLNKQFFGGFKCACREQAVHVTVFSTPWCDRVAQNVRVAFITAKRKGLGHMLYGDITYPKTVHFCFGFSFRQPFSTKEEGSLQPGPSAPSSSQN